MKTIYHKVLRRISFYKYIPTPVFILAHSTFYANHNRALEVGHTLTYIKYNILKRLK